VERGYVKLWRKIEDSAVFEDAYVFQLFTWLLLNVSRKSRQMLSGNTLASGSLTTTFNLLAERFDCSKATIHRRLHLLEELGVISISAERGFTVVTICNWTTYQSIESTDRTEGERKVNDSRTEGERKPNIEQEREKVRKREIEKEDSCSESPQTADAEPPTIARSEYDFPTKGKGPQTWNLRQDKLDEYRAAYPDLDVDAELRRARQWCRDTSAKRKTAGGMLTFLTRWLNRAQNNGGPSRNGSPPGRPTTREPPP
jgi:DNA-binding GntR family transcriptional regulator